MSTVTNWWTTRNQVERFDVLNRWPLYAISAAEPLPALLIVGSQTRIRPLGVAMLLLVVVAHMVCCVGVLHAGIEHRLGGPRPRVRLVGAMAGLAVAGPIAGLAAFEGPGLPSLAGPTGSPPGAVPVVLAVVLLFYGASLAAVTPVLWRSALVALIVLPAVAAGVLQAAVTADVGDDAPWAVSALLTLVSVVLAYRSSIWYLGIVWRIDRSRAMEARLAVAEERLRFSRDLHDVLGRNLALIAVSSDLATQLLRRGQDGAVDHLLAVNRIAQESIRELRDVVSGYRTVDLGVELEGARSVLRSAGVEVHLSGGGLAGDGAGLAADVQAALGWAVREAVTNIIRHSEASHARIDLSAAAPDGPVVLRIENDGVPARAARSAVEGSRGSGLPGVRERLAGLGGTLSAEALPGSRFRVEARLPLAPAARADLTS